MAEDARTPEIEVLRASAAEQAATIDKMRQRNEELEHEVASLRQQVVGANAEVEGRNARLGRERGDLAAQVRVWQQRAQDAEDQKNEQEISQLQDIPRSLSRQLARAEDYAHQLQMELQAQRETGPQSAADSSQLDSGASGLEYLESLLQEEKASHMDAVQQNRRLQDEIAEQRERIEYLENRLETQTHSAPRSESNMEGKSDDKTRTATPAPEEESLENRANVAKLEAERAKLLNEVDSMAGEIERLYDENVALMGGLSEATDICHNYEAQLTDVLALNKSLRKETVDQSNGSVSEADVLDLKSQLAEMSAKQVNSASALAELSKSYNPLLESIESQLLSLKSEFPSG